MSLQAAGARELRVRIAPGGEGGVVARPSPTATGAPVGTVGCPDLAAARSRAGAASGSGDRDCWASSGWRRRSPSGTRAPAEVELLRCETDGRRRRRRGPPDEAAAGRPGGGPGLARRRVEGRLAPGPDHPGRRRGRRRRVPRPRRRGGLGPDPLGPVRAPRPLRPDRQRRQRGLGGGAARGAGARGRGAPARLARGHGARCPRLARAEAAGRERRRPPADRPRAHRADHRRHRRPRPARRPPPGRARTAPATCSWSAAAAPRPRVRTSCARSSKRWAPRRRSPPATSPIARRWRSSSPRSPPSTRWAPSSTPPECSTTRRSQSLSGEQIEPVFAAKVDAAWNLHELTAEPRPLRLRPLLLRGWAPSAAPARPTTPPPTPSSTRLPSGAGSAGQPATSIAWGLWEREGGMALGPRARRDLARLAARRGRGALRRARPGPARRGARAPIAAVALAVPLDVAALRDAGVRRRPAADLQRPGAHAPPPRRRLRLARSEARRSDRGRGARASSSTWSGRRSPRCSVTPPRRRSSPAGPSRSSASTRWRRSSCATGSARPPGCACRRRVVFDYPSAGALAGHLLAEATASGAARQDRRSRPGQRRADRDRRHGLPLPGRGRARPTTSGELVAAGARRHHRVPRRSRLGPGAPLRPRSRPPRHQLHARGRLPRTTRPSSTPSSSASPRARR